tara:strand:+ start:1097 stop:1720 length:624 start_codon:yes stop_codon:yes gene_type:complete
MSNYNIAVAWSGKDALADSNPDKVVSGGDFNTEFTAVQTAVNSKADLAGSASQIFSATTAAAGTNTTQVATTAFVQAHYAYPIGAIFTTTAVYADSAAVVAAIGGTTWVAFGAGRVLVGLDSGDSDFDTSEKTGGAKTGAHTLTVSEMPAHTHDQFKATTVDNFSIDDTTRYTGAATVQTGSTGGGASHSHPIVQPYIVVYFWKRTA